MLTILGLGLALWHRHYQWGLVQKSLCYLLEPGVCDFFQTFVANISC